LGSVRKPTSITESGSAGSFTHRRLSPLLWQMRGAQAANVDPQRVVALEWLPAELLLAPASGYLSRGHHQ
jgi:hypothetical protein